MNGRLLVAVNAAPEAVTARFAVESASRVKVLFENRAIDSKNGLTDTFESNGVHVYRLKGEQQ